MCVLSSFCRIPHPKFAIQITRLPVYKNMHSSYCMQFLSSAYWGIVLSRNKQEISLDFLRSLWHCLAPFQPGLTARFKVWNKYEYIQLSQLSKKFEPVILRFYCYSPPTRRRGPHAYERYWRIYLYVKREL